MRPFDPTDDRPSPFPPSNTPQYVELYDVAYVTEHGNSQLAVVTYNDGEGSEAAAAQAVTATQGGEVQQVSMQGRVLLDSTQYHAALQRADTVIKRHDRTSTPDWDDPPVFWY